MRRVYAALALLAAGLALAGIVLRARSADSLRNLGSDLKVEYGPLGLERLTYRGQVLHDVQVNPDDAFHIWHMAATDQSGRKLSGGEYDWGENKSSKRWDLGSKTWTYQFSWGIIRAQYVQQRDQLDVNVVEVNYPGSGVVLQGASIYPLALHLSELPAGFVAGDAQLSDNDQEPGVKVAEYGQASIAVSLREERKPLFVGFEAQRGGDGSERKNVYEVLVSGTVPDSLKGAAGRRPPLAPGESDRYTLTIRFGRAGTPAAALGADAYRFWKERWPPTLTWPDRRVIGTVYLASSPRAEGLGGTEAEGNPRRYFAAQAEDRIDVRTGKGLEAFQRKVLKLADSTVENLRRLRAQGVITWDIEGEEFPQNTSYVCSPDQIAEVAPEMESTITSPDSRFAGMKLDDAYFKTFRDAGFKVGVCVRPQHFSRGADGRGKQETLPEGQVAAELIRKLRYAHDRWGATLFYLDSTVNAKGAPLDAAILDEAASAVPDSLLMPEQSQVRMYRATGPFQSFLFHGDPGTPATVRAIYPDAFSVNLVNDVDSRRLAGARDVLIDAVRHGDVLMVHADYWHPNNEVVMAIYREAKDQGS